MEEPLIHPVSENWGQAGRGIATLVRTVSLPRKETHLAVSIYPCSACGHRAKGKLAASYNAWFRADGVRVCYRQRLDEDCFSERILPLIAGLSEAAEDLCSCVICHADASDDLDPTYLTVYLPGAEVREYQMPMHGACAAGIRQRLMDGGELMADRGAQMRGPSSSAPRKDWTVALP